MWVIRRIDVDLVMWEIDSDCCDVEGLQWDLVVRVSWDVTVYIDSASNEFCLRSIRCLVYLLVRVIHA